MPFARASKLTIQPRAGDGSPFGAARSVEWFSSIGSRPPAAESAATVSSAGLSTLYGPAAVEGGDRAGGQQLHPLRRLPLRERQAGAQSDRHRGDCGVKGNGVMIGAAHARGARWHVSNVKNLIDRCRA